LGGGAFRHLYHSLHGPSSCTRCVDSSSHGLQSNPQRPWMWNGCASRQVFARSHACSIVVAFVSFPARTHCVTYFHRAVSGGARAANASVSSRRALRRLPARPPVHAAPASAIASVDRAGRDQPCAGQRATGCAAPDATAPRPPFAPPPSRAGFGALPSNAGLGFGGWRIILARAVRRGLDVHFVHGHRIHHDLVGISTTLFLDVVPCACSSLSLSWTCVHRSGRVCHVRRHAPVGARHQGFNPPPISARKRRVCCHLRRGLRLGDVPKPTTSPASSPPAAAHHAALASPFFVGSPDIPRGTIPASGGEYAPWRSAVAFAALIGAGPPVGCQRNDAGIAPHPGPAAPAACAVCHHRARRLSPTSTTRKLRRKDTTWRVGVPSPAGVATATARPPRHTRKYIPYVSQGRPAPHGFVLAGPTAPAHTSEKPRPPGARCVCVPPTTGITPSRRRTRHRRSGKFPPGFPTAAQRRMTPRPMGPPTWPESATCLACPPRRSAVRPLRRDVVAGPQTAGSAALGLASSLACLACGGCCRPASRVVEVHHVARWRHGAVISDRVQRHVDVCRARSPHHHSAPTCTRGIPLGISCLSDKPARATDAKEAANEGP